MEESHTAIIALSVFAATLLLRFLKDSGDKL
jgi:hypothetical protein